jgi:hypothetical protein
MNNITDVLNSVRNSNASFNALQDIVSSGQIKGAIYNNVSSLSEAQKSAWVDGYNIHDTFFLRGNVNGL